jgi:hypothetical protein
VGERSVTHQGLSADVADAVDYASLIHPTRYGFNCAATAAACASPRAVAAFASRAAAGGLRLRHDAA